ncbi:hypothetical protein BBJ28_00001885, partial [Nothophytophthora sp. Chile5]
MAKKRRATAASTKKASAAATAMSSSPFPYPSPSPAASAAQYASPPSARRRLSAPRVSTAPRSGVAASTRSQRSVAAATAPVLSPPLKKRVLARRDAKAVKFSLQDDDETEDEDDGASLQLRDKTTYYCARHQQEEADDDSTEDEEELLPPQIRPDPYLPETYQRQAVVLQHGGCNYDAMLTRARVHHNHSEFIALQALEFERQFYLWTRAGRVGCAGKTTLSGPFSSADRVAREFCALFLANTNCEWDERHALRYQEGSYTWIELDYSTGTPYSESLTSALTDNQGEMDYADSFRDFDLVPLPLPLPVASSSRRRRRRAAMWTSSSASNSTATPATPTTSARRSLGAQFDWLYASNSESEAGGRAAVNAAACACASPPPSRLPQTVQDFVTLIANHTELSYAYTVTDELLGDAIMKLPLGRLSKTTIQRVRLCLLLLWGNGGNEIFEALRSRQTSRSRLSHLSSHFYSLIPHHSRLEVIDTMVKLGKKVRLMAEVGASVRGMAHEPVAQRCASRNYLDECYALLDCELHPVLETDPDFALIQTYVRNSNCCGRKQDRLQLLSVFRVEKHDQEHRFEPFRNLLSLEPATLIVAPLAQILWHGSHLANWLGILTEGLRIAPPEVASNGRTFGKGLYFTDKVTKAQAYCHCRPTNGHNQ